MGIGHLAIGFTGRRFAPKVPFGLLLASGFFVDLIWGVLVLAGVEQAQITPGITEALPLDLLHIPWTHSLVAAFAWSFAYAGGYYAWRRDWQGATWLFAGVLSHWVLDVVTHIPDMPILPSGPKIGLGLWNSVAATLVVEGLMVAGGVWLYVRSTRARDAIGQFGLVAFVAFIAALHFATYLGPTPPDIRALAALSVFTVVPFWVGHWIDGHREFTGPAESRL